MMKKKLITFVLAATLFCAVSVPAFGKEIDKPGDQDTELTYSVDTDYVVVIPESVTLNESIVITSGRANTEPGMAVKVRITEGLTKGSVTLDRDNDNSGYAITARLKLDDIDDDDIINSDTVVASFSDIMTSSDETTQITGGTLSFSDPVSPDKKPIKAGSYTGSLTFTVSYEEA